MLKILLVDNAPLFTVGLEVALKSIPGQEVVAIINKLVDLEEACIKYKPDAVFIRDCLAKKNEGFEGVHIVKRSFPDIKVILILTLADPLLIEAAKQSGADNYVFVSDEPAVYNSCLWNTMKGQSSFSNIEVRAWRGGRADL